MATNVVNEIKFAKTIVKVGGYIVAKVTSWTDTAETSEENITGAEDYIAGTDVLREQYTSISVGQTAEMEGIAIEDPTTGRDDGQSALKEAAKSGEIVELVKTNFNGFGYTYSGFFTNYEESASSSEVYKWTGSFRINSEAEITPGS